MKQKSIFIGTASWSIPKQHSNLFEFGKGPIYPILKRYAQVFNAVEINSSFYREHQMKTYAKWAEIVPEDFRFSVKLFRKFTHEQRLEVIPHEVHASIEAIKGLGEKLGILLVQLPPKQEFLAETVTKFMDIIRSCFDGPVAIEPRHATWSDEKAFKLLDRFQVSKVWADPERCKLESEFCGWGRLKYYRLHGSPEIYKSTYTPEYLKSLAQEVLTRDNETWCIFDNTQYGCATENAVELQRLIKLS